MKKLLIPISFLLVSCSTSTVQQVPQEQPKVEIQKISLPALCYDVEKNQLRAETVWKDKPVAIPAKVAKIGSTYSNSKFIKIDNNKAMAIIANGPVDINSLISVNKSDDVTVVGLIDNVSIAEFQKDSYERYKKEDVASQVDEAYCTVYLKKYGTYK